MRRESPNRFSKVFKYSHHTIIYIFISLFYYFMIYIFSPTNFRLYKLLSITEASLPEKLRF
jgi:hypothetical protein